VIVPGRLILELPISARSRCSASSGLSAATNVAVAWWLAPSETVVERTSPR
jgi:hypothetical protein